MNNHTTVDDELSFSQLVELKGLATQLSDGKRVDLASAWPVISKSLPTLVKSYEQRGRLRVLLKRAYDFTTRKFAEGAAVVSSNATAAFVKDCRQELGLVSIPNRSPTPKP